MLLTAHVMECLGIVTQLLVDDLLVYNGTVGMASRMSAVNCHTIVFTDNSEQELTSANTTAIMYIYLAVVTCYHCHY